ncbi:MAG: YifB family Mg chelatase-like AAA ATPase [Deltaproteobacteria bacterium]|nr:YifB family Mg chelatase-like AAA ATPase [Deltaproteobacteria bacterium]
MYARTLTAGLVGIDACLINVEVDIRLTQIPSWNTVGLPDSAVKESKDRVKAAIRNSGYDFIFRKVTINLAPANIKKDGTAFDLPIALGLMAASGNLRSVLLDNTIIVGELSLTGDIRPTRGVLPIAIMAMEKKIKNLIVPHQNAQEAAIVSGVSVFSFGHFSEVVEFLSGRQQAKPVRVENFKNQSDSKESPVDFSDIYGQYQAKRAIEIAASGSHNILLNGSPGSGKTMLAARVPTILPLLTFNESLETSKIYSVMGLLKDQSTLLRVKPFRSPHHSISNSGLIGGGSYPRPGEVSLAHNGVLFLDELPEFQKNVLELLRQPLESHEVTIARASISLTYPARFILVSSCNPCPCGFLGHPKKPCSCTIQQIQKYKAKISGPLLDRIDLQVHVPPVPYSEFRTQRNKNESSIIIAKRVKKAHDIQQKRFAGETICYNSFMTNKMIEKHCALDQNCEGILKTSMEKFHLSARAVSRILKVSRTIADMDGSENIKTEHILESVQYRGIEWCEPAGEY